MQNIVLVLALLTPGVQYGWQSGADGQLEYIIELEDIAINALRAGKEVSSDIHPDVVRSVRRFVVRAENPQPNRPVISNRNAQPPAAQYGWKPGSDGQLEYYIQLNSSAIDALEQGQELSGNIHPDVLGRVRRLVLRVGDGPLPRTLGNLAAQDDLSRSATVSSPASNGATVPTPAQQPRSVPTWDGWFTYGITPPTLSATPPIGSLASAPEPATPPVFPSRYGEPPTNTPAHNSSSQLYLADNTPLAPPPSGPALGGRNSQAVPSITAFPQATLSPQSNLIPQSEPPRSPDARYSQPPSAPWETWPSHRPDASGRAPAMIASPPPGYAPGAMVYPSDAMAPRTGAEVSNDGRFLGAPRSPPPVAQTQGTWTEADGRLGQGTVTSAPWQPAAGTSSAAPRGEMTPIADGYQGGNYGTRNGYQGAVTGERGDVVAERPTSRAITAEPGVPPSPPPRIARSESPSVQDQSESNASLTESARRQSARSLNPASPEAPQVSEQDVQHLSRQAAFGILNEILLFASLGVNVVAIVIARQYYLRYCTLIRQMREQPNNET